MAQRGLQLDHERLSCPICLDLLKDPTTLSSGHNYCMNCITKRWDEESQGGIHTCPQCRQTFIQKPVLEKNTLLADFLEELKKTRLEAAPHPQHYAGPGDVSCDLCSGRKVGLMRDDNKLRTQQEQRDVVLLQQQLDAIDGSADKDLKDSQTRFSQLPQLVEEKSCEVQQQIRSQQQTEMVEDGDEEEVLKNLKSVVPPECFEYAEKLLKLKSVSHFELLKLYRVLAEKMQEGRISRQTTQSAESSYGFFLSFLPVFGSTIKIFCITTGQTFGAENIIEQMATQLKNVQIACREECDIIIVFCPITARVGSDVEAALRREEVSSSDKPVILVLMHHTRDVEYSAGGRKWAQNDPKIVLEVVVLFHETQPGLLQCETNKEAIKEIQKVLQKHSKNWRWW